MVIDHQEPLSAVDLEYDIITNLDLYLVFCLFFFGADAPICDKHIIIR